MAFTAGFFFGQPFFFTSMRYLGLGLLLFFFPCSFYSFVLICSVLIITQFLLMQRGGHSRARLGGSKKEKTSASVRGQKIPTSLVGLRGSGFTVDKIGSRRVFGGGDAI